MAPDGEPAAPRVSVVVATYNSRLTLAAALASVGRQTVADFEVRVVGDACTDGSEAVVAALGDPRFHWTNRAENSGSQAAPNDEGTRQARGRYVAYLGHDDLWFPWHLETLLEAARTANADLAHGLGVLLGPEGCVAASGPPRGTSYVGHNLPPTNWLVARDWLTRAGGWGDPDESVRPIDVDVFARLVAAGARIACARRITTVKFPSPLWRTYAADAARPQIAMGEAMAADPEAVEQQLLTEAAIAFGHRAFPLWAPPVGSAWRAAAASLRRAASATLRATETTPGLAAICRWQFQRARRRVRRRRGLA